MNLQHLPNVIWGKNMYYHKDQIGRTFCLATFFFSCYTALLAVQLAYRRESLSLLLNDIANCWLFESFVG